MLLDWPHTETFKGPGGWIFISQNILINQFQKVNSLIDVSTLCLQLVIQIFNWRFCWGVDFVKTSMTPLCQKNLWALFMNLFDRLRLSSMRAGTFWQLEVDFWQGAWWWLGAILPRYPLALLSHIMYLLISLEKSAPPQNRQRIVLMGNSQQ